MSARPAGAAALIVAVAAMNMLLPTAGVAQLNCQSYWTAAYKCLQGCGPCPNASSGPPVPAGPSAEQLEAQRVKQLDFNNDAGIAAYKRGDYTAAVGYFEEARKFNPHHPKILENLRKARKAVEESLKAAEAAASERKQSEEAAVERAKAAAARNLALEQAKAAADPGTAIVRPDQGPVVPATNSTFNQAPPAAGPKSPPPEEKKVEGRRVFEDEARRSGTPLIAVATPPSKLLVPDNIRDLLSKNRDWNALESRERELLSQQAKSDREVAKIKEDLDKKADDKGGLLLQLGQARRRQNETKAKLDDIVVEKETFAVNFAQQATVPAAPTSDK